MLAVLRKYVNLFLESLEKFGENHIPDHSRHTYNVVVSVILIFLVVQGLQAFMEMISVPALFALLVVFAGFMFFGVRYLNKTDVENENQDNAVAQVDPQVDDQEDAAEVWPHRQTPPENG